MSAMNGFSVGPIRSSKKSNLLLMGTAEIESLRARWGKSAIRVARRSRALKRLASELANQRCECEGNERTRESEGMPIPPSAYILEPAR
jgi:hypothetical protein